MDEGLAQRVASIDWYHTIELADGVITPGWLDHRQVLERIPLPLSLSGCRCLDVGTFNGFWAFEMERRGAEEVLAVDVLDPRRWDWPVNSDEATIREIGRRMAGGDGFEIAADALGSKVRRLDRSVYGLERREVGQFDLAYVGSLLVHLRDPVLALERIAAVADTVVIVDGVDLALTLRHRRLPAARLDGRGRPWWWYPNLAGLGRLARAAGLELSQAPRLLFVPPGRGWRPKRWVPRALSSREGRYQLTAAWLGDPHGSLVAAHRR